MNRADCMDIIRGAILAAFIVLVAAASISPAAAQPCPPRHFFCWQVKAAVATFGADALETHVRACGWREIDINRARRCLKTEEK
jgi:cobalamin biosynthesis protein CobD/CbiB